MKISEAGGLLAELSPQDMAQVNALIWGREGQPSAIQLLESAFANNSEAQFQAVRPLLEAIDKIRWQRSIDWLPATQEARYELVHKDRWHCKSR